MSNNMKILQLHLHRATVFYSIKIMFFINATFKPKICTGKKKLLFLFLEALKTIKHFTFEARLKRFIFITLGLN